MSIEKAKPNIETVARSLSEIGPLGDKLDIQKLRKFTEDKTIPQGQKLSLLDAQALLYEKEAFMSLDDVSDADKLEQSRKLRENAEAIRSLKKELEMQLMEQQRDFETKAEQSSIPNNEEIESLDAEHTADIEMSEKELLEALGAKNMETTAEEDFANLKDEILSRKKTSKFLPDSVVKNLEHVWDNPDKIDRLSPDLRMRMEFILEKAETSAFGPESDTESITASLDSDEQVQGQKSMEQQPKQENNSVEGSNLQEKNDGQNVGSFSVAGSNNNINFVANTGTYLGSNSIGSDPGSIEGMSAKEERKAMQAAVSVEDKKQPAKKEENSIVETPAEKSEPKEQEQKDSSDSIGTEYAPGSFMSVSSVETKDGKQKYVKGSIYDRDPGLSKEEWEKDAKYLHELYGPNGEAIKRHNKEIKRDVDKQLTKARKGDSTEQSKAQIIETRKFLDAKKAFESAWENELERKNKGFKGSINRLRDNFSSKAFEMSPETKKLRDEFLKLQSERTLTRYSKVLENFPEDEREAARKRMYDKIFAKAEKDFNFETETKRKKQEEGLNEYNKKTAEGTVLPVILKLKDAWMRKNPATKLALGTAIATPLMVALSPLAVGGAAGYAGYRAGRGLLGMMLGAGVVKGLSLLEKDKLELIEKEYAKQWQNIDKGDMAKMQEILRAKGSELDDTQKKYLRRKVGLGILAGGLGAGLAMDQIGISPNIPETAGAPKGASQLSGSESTNVLESNQENFSKQYAQQEMPGHERGLGEGQATLDMGVSSESAYIVQPGDGAIKSIIEVRKDIAAQYPDGNYPAAMRDSLTEFMNKDPMTIAVESGLFDPHASAESAVMYTGDTFSFNSDGSFVLERGPEGQAALGLTEDERFFTLMSDVNGTEQGGVVYGNFDGAMMDTDPVLPTDTPTYQSFEQGSAGSSSEIPAGVDPKKVYFDQTSNTWRAYTEYAQDPTVLGTGIVPGDLSFTAGNELSSGSTVYEQVQQPQQRVEVGDISQEAPVQDQQESFTSPQQPESNTDSVFTGSEEMRNQFFREIAETRDGDVMKFIMQDPANRLAQIIPDGIFDGGFGNYQDLFDAMQSDGVVMPTSNTDALAFVHDGYVYRIGMYESGNLENSYVPMLQVMEEDKDGIRSFRTLEQFDAKDPFKMKKALEAVIGQVK